MREDPEVILIAPEARLITAILKSSRVRVRCFSSSADYDAWRATGRSAPPILAGLVDQLVDRAALPPQVQLALAWLGHQPSVPTLKAFAEAVCPRRSFFRAWSRAIAQRPSEFLDHLRALHAQLLLAHGSTTEEVAATTGCRSPLALRRLLEHWH